MRSAVMGWLMVAGLFSAVPSVGALADIVALDIVPDDPSLPGGGGLLFENRGDEAAGVFTVAYKASGSSGTFRVEGLGVGEQSTRRASWGLWQGRMEVSFEVDSGDDVRESDEGNNRIVRVFEVPQDPAGRPDLAVDVVGPAIVFQGQRVEARAIVSNLGTKHAGYAPARWLLDGSQVFGVQDGSGYAGRNRTVSLQSLWLAPGNHSIEFRIDHLGDDVDASNDHDSLQLEVVAGPRWCDGDRLDSGAFLLGLEVPQRSVVAGEVWPTGFRVVNEGAAVAPGLTARALLDGHSVVAKVEIDGLASGDARSWSPDEAAWRAGGVGPHNLRWQLVDESEAVVGSGDCVADPVLVTRRSGASAPADLVITGLTLDSGWERRDLEVRVKNTGPGQAAASTVAYSPNGGPLVFRSLSALGAGSSATVVFPASHEAATHGFTLDYYDDVSESNEDDNVVLRFASDPSIRKTPAWGVGSLVLAACAAAWVVTLARRGT